MQYLELKKRFKDSLVFTLNDIKKIEPFFHRQRLNDWQNKGYIKKIIKGHYIFLDLEINDQVLFFIANKIFEPSYISLEMALSYYGLIPESVYEITSVSSKKTYAFKLPMAQFSYKKIKPELMFGYKLVNFNNHVFKIAEVEKAILDFFYINSKYKTMEDIEELRFSKDIFLEKVSLEKLKNYLKQFKSAALEKRINLFVDFITHA